jgi:hypothetical protein
MAMGFGVKRNATLFGYCGFCVARKEYPFFVGALKGINL